MDEDDSDRLAIAASRAAEARADITKLVWGTASMLILVISGWMANELSGLAESDFDQEARMIRLEERMMRMPPPELVLRIEKVEQRQQETDMLLRTISQRVHKKLGIDTGSIARKRSDEAQGG